MYRDFCRGHAIAFEEGYASAWGMPSATGIGTWGNGVGFYFLASRTGAMTHIENSRQIPAYRYPSLYGPKALSFARATHVSAARDTLYVSGTASIVGHETLQAGDLVKQWDVATGNIAHLIGADNLASQGIVRGFTLHDLDQIKVYYHHADDLPAVKQLGATHVRSARACALSEGRFCRADLVVEIEAIASSKRMPS